jgi:hypothetical protein
MVPASPGRCALDRITESRRAGGVQLDGRAEGAGGLVLEQAYQLVHQGQLVLSGGTTDQVPQINESRVRRVLREQVLGFLGLNAVCASRGFLRVAQLSLQALGEELLIEAGGWGLVGHG